MYVYRGTQRGDKDPWQQERERAPKRRRHEPNPGRKLPPGVFWHPNSGRYQARVKYKGVARYNGTHATPEAAAQAAKELRARLQADDPTWGRLQPCGTHAAFQRHHRNGETPCEPCRKAESQYTMQIRKKAA